MPYRMSARTEPSDTAVACARCGALTSLAIGANRGGRFQCRKCDLDQLVLREDLDVASIALTDYNAYGSYEQLQPFAKELGKDVQCSGIDVVVDGVAVKVGLNINSGSVTGLDHFASTVGLPAIRFVTEKPIHVEGKARGVMMEVQTGDAAFDDEVYVESAASEQDVRTVLSAPAVRRAIQKLLSEAEAVVMDEKAVSVFVGRMHEPWEPKTLRRRLEWMRVVAGAPRPLATEYVAVPARARIAKRIVGWTYPVVMFLTVLGLAKWCPLHAEVVFECIGAGIVLALVMLPIWTLLLRGRSTSHREILAWRIATFIYAPLLVVGTLTTYNGAFDDSKERAVTMKIVRVSKGEDDDNWHAATVDAEGREHSYPFRGEPIEGWTLSVGWKDGALGWVWESRGAIVVETQKP